MARDKEKILTLGCEGGGIDVYRLGSEDGGWKYFQEGSSIAIDDNDEEYWPSWKSPTFDSLSAVLDDASMKQWFPVFIVSRLHPDYREELIAWARKAVCYLSDDFFRRHRMHDFDPEKWADRHRVFGGRVD